MEIKPSLESGENKKKTTMFKNKKKSVELIIAAVLGIIAILIYLSTLSSCSLNKKTESEGTDVQAVTAQLCSVLGKIKGAGKVSVMITYEDSGETIYATNDEKLVETVTDGGETTENVTEKSTIVMVGGKPLIEKVLQPKVKGVLIVAEGGSDARVKLDLIRATQVALSVSANVIEVFST